MSDNTDARDRYWQKTRNLTIVILVLWAFFSLFIPLIVSPLNNLTFLGFPLGYYMAAQGSLAIFVVEIVIYAKLMNAKDLEFGIREGDE